MIPIKRLSKEVRGFYSRITIPIRDRKLPCINCLTLPMCRSKLERQDLPPRYIIGGIASDICLPLREYITVNVQAEHFCPLKNTKLVDNVTHYFLYLEELAKDDTYWKDWGTMC